MSALSGARLVRSGLRDARGVSALLALLIAAGAVLAVGAPRATDHVLTTGLHADLAHLGAGRSAIEALASNDSVSVSETRDRPSVSPVWTAMASRLAAIRRSTPGLDDILGRGAYVGQAGAQGQLGFIGDGTATSAPSALLSLIHI